MSSLRASSTHSPPVGPLFSLFSNPAFQESLIRGLVKSLYNLALAICGGIAQLEEHLLCEQGVTGSSPVTSTNLTPF